MNQNYLVFSDGDIWITKFLKTGFGHIRIVVNDGYNWIHFNPSCHQFEWDIMPYESTDTPFKDHFKNSTIIKLHLDPKRNSWVGRIGMMTCVLMVKYFLGIKCRPRTPYQLYRYLIDNELGELYGPV